MTISLTPQPQPADKVLLLDEVAELTRVPAETLRFWRQAGKGPTSYKLGRRVVYNASDVEAWMNAQKAATASA